MTFLVEIYFLSALLRLVFFDVLLDCVDIDGYKIVNVYKASPTRLQMSDIPMFPHPCLYTGDFNCLHTDWGYNLNSVDGNCVASWAGINLHNPKNQPIFYSGSWNIGTNPNLTFVSDVCDNRLYDKLILEKFSWSQHNPMIIIVSRK